MIHVFTSAAPNYLGKVRALMHSLRLHHPEWRLHLFLADRRGEASSSNGRREPWDETHHVDELALGTDPRWLFSHSIVELCTAVKGAAAQRLLERDDVDILLYFDPDIVVFDRLDDLVASLSGAAIALTPHLLTPESDQGAVLDNEVCALRHGTFNLGFLGLRKGAETSRFLAWWTDRLEHFCWAEPESGLFTDQRWLDLAPSFFSDLVILRDPRFNVAPWNISQRRLSGSFDEGFVVNGRPLGFYHFTGFDSGAHRAMVGKYGTLNTALAMLVEWYDLRCQALGNGNGDRRWRLGFYANGDPVETNHRVVYRRRLDLKAAFPDPYVVDGRGGDFLTWVRHQGPVEYPDLLG
jgi:hypothetical protein